MLTWYRRSSVGKKVVGSSPKCASWRIRETLNCLYKLEIYKGHELCTILGEMIRDLQDNTCTTSAT